ncbi:two-component system VirA-like sensor kinase [Dongia sedimenti]|uniref:histidine kinase n=1 Tax=Dongia sedimenti TaxID=3064282 RepID=A0ABU0YVD9_9PROT|nr:two-component system VirA-like sensor kinase [Rhodospirillaceae bacterium R-7]
MHLKQIAGAGLLLLLLTWLALRSTSSTAHSVQLTLNVLDEVAAAESALHRDLLGVRTGLLNNYDPIVAETKIIREAIPRLRTNAPADPQIAKQIDHFEKIVELQEQETERFKSRNALLRNSLTYFQLFSARLSASTTDPVLVSRVGGLTAAMLHLTQDSTPTVIQDVDTAMKGIPVARFPDADMDTADALVAHARLLRDLLPATDQGLKTLFALPSHEQQERIRSLTVARGAICERKAARYRYALYAVSLILAGALIMLGLRLERRARHMRRRADIEHVIAGISTRFINARSEFVPIHIERALEELSYCLGADRAYFIAGGDAPRSYLWRRPGVHFPTDWPLGTLAAASAVRDRPAGMIRTRRGDSSALNDVARMAGTSDWFCISATGDQPSEGLLGFESLEGELKLTEGDCGLWRMAFDSIAHAIEREVLEDSRRTLEAKLQQARRMETIGTLASGIAHNFNNIVGAILGYAEMALAHVRAGSAPAESLTEIRRAGERARDLIDQILGFGRRSEAGRQSFRLDGLIAEAKSLLVATLPSTVKLDFARGTGEAIVLSGIPGQLQQVLVNICNNAIQAVDGEGVVAMATRLVDVAAPLPLAHNRLPPGRYVVISICDNGRGMDQSTQEQIFEPFFTTREEGNGLGLATALEIVSGHGGDITVDSAIGEGTRFDIWLPCDAPRDIGSGPVPEPMARGSGETVMICESDRDLLMKQEEIVAALGYEPAGFACVADLVEAYKATPWCFDVALVCSCPHLDAVSRLEAVASLRRAAASLPIIFAVTSAASLAVPMLAAAGVTEIIGLPLVSSELADALARCSRRAIARSGRAEIEDAIPG